MHKLKLLASSVALAGFSATAIAAPELYLGAELGYQNTDMEYSWKETSGGSTYSGGTDYSADGVAGGVFAGAKFALGGGYYLAPEINLGTSDADGGQHASYPGYQSETKIEAGKSYGISVLFGKELTSDTRLYGRLGYQRTDYDVTYTETGSDTESFDETYGGVRYGLGVETALAEQLALRLDWSQIQYSDEGESEEPFPGYEVHDAFEPTESRFQVGLTYSF